MGKIALMLGGWPAGDLCTISELSGLLGSRELAHENCAIFWVRSRSTVGKVGWKNCAIFSFSGVGKACSLCEIFEGGQSRGGFRVQLFS